MKKLVIVISTISLLLIGCGSNKTIDGVDYETVGLFTEDERGENIEYKIIKGNVIWSIFLANTVVFPVYFIGLSLFEPVGLKDNQ